MIATPKQTAVSEKPILFSGAMVRAILDGRKTQTRRAVKPQPTTKHICSNGETYDEAPYWTWRPRNNKGKCLGAEESTLKTVLLNLCPYGKPGDRLWVRETFLYRAQRKGIVYRSDYDSTEAAGIGALYGGWKPSIFMPHWASRLTLEIVSVRVERLQQIRAKDIIAEGAVIRPHHVEGLGKCPVSAFDGVCYPDLRTVWIKGWDSINGKTYPWKSSPWVWVVSFRKL